jgi:riboflavin-specific deaminase-like protein
VNSKPKKVAVKSPFVFVNMAMTADGKIATANRAVHSFGSARDLRHLYELRATADAVMCGARTVEISHSILDNGGKKFGQLRVQRGLSEHNLRVIVSGSGSIDPTAEIFQRKFSPIIVLTTKRASAKKLAQLRLLADEVKVFGEREVNLRSAMRWLHQKYGVKRLLCEGGGELNDAMFRAGLVDEVHLTVCPKIFGGRIAPTISEGEGFAKLSLTANLKLVATKLINGELFTIYRRA